MHGPGLSQAMYRLLAGLMVTSVLLALGAVATASAEDQKYQVYANPKGYQVEISADWPQDPAPPPPFDAHFSSTDHRADILLQANERAVAPDPQQVLSGLSTELYQAHPGFVATQPLPDSLPGADATALGGGTWTEGNTLWVAYLAVAVRGTTLYEMRVATTWEYHNDHNEQLNHLLESFQLIALG
jgi:hypothetical protein